MRKFSVNALDFESLTHVKIFYSPLFLDLLKLIFIILISLYYVPFTF